MPLRAKITFPSVYSTCWYCSCITARAGVVVAPRRESERLRVDRHCIADDSSVDDSIARSCQKMDAVALSNLVRSKFRVLAR
jgi:hypothetical protein